MQRKRFRNCKVTPPANYPNPCLYCGYSGLFLWQKNNNCSMQHRSRLSVLNCTLTSTSPFNVNCLQTRVCMLTSFQSCADSDENQRCQYQHLVSWLVSKTPNNPPLVSRGIQAHRKERRFIDSGKFLLEISSPSVWLKKKKYISPGHR